MVRNPVPFLLSCGDSSDAAGNRFKGTFGKECGIPKGLPPTGDYSSSSSSFIVV